MNLYDITITARITDIDELKTKLSADINVADASLRRIAMDVLPAHLRKVADDIETTNNAIRPSIDAADVIPDAYADEAPDDEDCAPDCNERDTCNEPGTVGHSMCGHCSDHDQPRHHCGCPQP